MYPSLAKAMFCSFRRHQDNNYFGIQFKSGETEVVTPQLVSELIGIPIFKNGYILEISKPFL